MVHIDSLSVLQDAIKMATGKDEIEALDSAKLQDYGKDIFDSGSAETFLNGLISLCGDIVIDSRTYKGDLAYMNVKSSEWGGFTERTRIELATIVKDPKWNLYANSQLSPAKTDYSAEENSYYPVKTSTRIFENSTSVMTPVSKPVDQLKEAFKGMAQMDRFIQAIGQAVQNTLELAMQNYRHMLVQCAIALSIANGTAVHLLTEAITLGIVPAATTAATAIQSKDFLAYCAERIAEVRDNSQGLTNAYIPSGDVWHTPRDMQKMCVLSSFARKMKFNVYADTFNKEEISFGDFVTTPSWQGVYTSTNAPFNFADASTVIIAKSDEAEDNLGIEFGEDETEWSQSYVIGLLTDEYTMGIGALDRKVTGNYVASGDFFNEFHHLKLNTILDSRYMCVAFVID